MISSNHKSSHKPILSTQLNFYPRLYLSMTLVQGLVKLVSDRWVMMIIDCIVQSPMISTTFPLKSRGIKNQTYLKETKNYYSKVCAQCNLI